MPSATQTPNATPPAAPAPGAQAGSLGVTARAITPEDRTRFQLQANEPGLVITALSDNSDLVDKGVQVGDLILQAGGHAVRTPQELAAAANTARQAHRPLLLQVEGRGGRRFVAADVGEG